MDLYLSQRLYSLVLNISGFLKFINEERFIHLPITNLTIDADHDGQRIDNFLITFCKGVPKSRIYRAVRKGEVRVNKKRVKPEYRLQRGDELRVPPLRVPEPDEKPKAGRQLLQSLEERILSETPELIVINKLSGIPVHGGTGVSLGLIEALRQMRPQQKFMELVHRLDRETSGCLLIAKKRRMLLELHQLLTRKKVTKQYIALLKGDWQGGRCEVDAPLLKYQRVSGERFVRVSDEGKPALTRFRPLLRLPGATLVEASPVTGRTHQIRVHAQHLGHPIAGDEKYGDEAFNKRLRKIGLRRLFLHSASISCQLQEPNGPLGICAPLDIELSTIIDKLQQA